MEKTFRKLSVLLLISALAAMAALLIFDALNHLHLTSIHKWTGALAFMLIGASYISLQLSTNRQWNETLKRIMLGVGFFLWGCEQFLPPSIPVTVMDSIVVLIFVTDLTLIIAKNLRHKGEEML
jgi:peptidoglycan/LPS O-acetylase OafA/YrhL